MAFVFLMSFCLGLGGLWNPLEMQQLLKIVTEPLNVRNRCVQVRIALCSGYFKLNQSSGFKFTQKDFVYN